MSDRAIARRYASALNAEAGETNTVDRVDADMELLHETIGGSRELRLLFSSPVVHTSKKADIIRRLFVEHVSDLVLRFLLLINEKGREGIISEIVDAYRSLRLEQEGIVEAHARVAIMITEDEKASLQASLSGKTGSEIRLHVEEDTGLVGGLIVKIGDQVYDGSLMRKLAVLKRKLAGGSFHN